MVKESPKAQPEGVILLHGLARTKRSMRTLANFLRQQGYLVANVGYPSCCQAIPALAAACIPPALEELHRQGAGRIHFVTHSMGGILVRAYLKQQPCASLGRVVMLSPPNQGSELAEVLLQFSWFRWLFGPAGCQLGTGEASLPLQLGPVSSPVGIVTGNRSLGWLSARIFPGPNDGKVSVARAALEGMADFLVVPCGHAFIMHSQLVKKQVATFLATGQFAR